MKIGVTGGAGFIGSHIVDAYLQMGHEVVVLDNLYSGTLQNVNSRAKFIEIDITSENLLNVFKNERFDVVSHHAAQIQVKTSVENPILDAQINVIGGLNVYESCVKSGVKKVVFASSGGTVYGNQISFPADESHQTIPVSPYGTAKIANEYYLNFYKETHGLDFVALRYMNAYGPRQNPHGEAGVVAIFIEKLLQGINPTIFGSGVQTRDYIFISDIVAANVLALAPEVSGSFNVSTALETSVNDIFNEINTIGNFNSSAKYEDAKPGEPMRGCTSYEKFKNLTGWHPRTDLKSGLAATIEWFRHSIR